MNEVTFGDIFFILLICGVIYVITTLANRSKRAESGKMPTSPEKNSSDDNFC
jgi:hypothetical protein